jgi:hypoxanthine phosphoribosyltransferase
MASKNKNQKINGVEFVPFMESKTIYEKVKEIANSINNDYQGLNPVFVIVMNGAFVFAADLLRRIKIECDIKFVQAKSYVGLDNTGEVEINWPPETNFTGRHVIIVEDIIDTGHTIHRLNIEIQKHKPSSIEVTAIFVKPDAHIHKLEIKYPGLQIPQAFIIGYGLDYHGLGRNLKHVYQILE